METAKSKIEGLSEPDEGAKKTPEELVKEQQAKINKMSSLDKEM